MNQVAIAALAVLTVASVALWTFGRRYVRRYVELHGTAPPATWMFRKTDDPKLEEPRRLALMILPIDLIALAVYFSQP